MMIHLVAIILSNLAGLAWLVDIKYVFEKTNGLPFMSLYSVVFDDVEFG